MSGLHANQPHPDNDPESPSPRSLRSCRYKPIIGHCIASAIPTILALPMVIFLVIPALMPPEFELNRNSSISSPNISTSQVTVQWNIFLSVKNPSKLIAVKYTYVKLLLSFGQFTLTGPLVIPAFTQGPSNVTTVQAKALSTLMIINDLKGGREVTIDVVVKAKRRLHLGPWRVPVFDVCASCMDVTFMALTNSKGVGNWKVLGGTLGCTLDILTQLW